MKSIIYICCLLIILQSCENSAKQSDDFYSATQKEDLWRVPLIEPYEIVSPTNSELNDWFLIIDTNELQGPDFTCFGNEFQFTNIQQIGIKDSMIVICNDLEYWSLLSGQYPSTLIINAKTGEKFIYSNTHHSKKIEEKMHELHVNGIELLTWSEVKTDFLEHQQLPKSWK